MLSRLRAQALPLSLLAPFVLALLIAPWLIERQVQAALDLRALRTQIAASIQQRTGLRLNVQGAHYDLFRGIVLNGARLYQEADGEERRYAFQAESVSLRFSLLAYLRGQPPVSKIVLNGARLAPGFGLNDWRRLISASLQQQNQQANPWIDPQAVLSADDMRLNLAELELEGNDQIAGEHLSIDLEATPDRGGFRFQSNVRLVGGEGGAMRLRGAWQRDGSARAQIEIDGAPLRLLTAMSAGAPFAPFKIGGESAGVLIRRGQLSATGSFDLYQNGSAGFNLQGGYRELSAEAGDPAFRLVRLRKGRGQLQLNGGFDSGARGSAYSILSMEQEGLKLRVESTHLIQAATGRGAPPPRKEVQIEAQIEFSEGEDGLQLAGVGSGRATLQLHYQEERQVDLHGNVQLQSLRFDLPEVLRSDTLDPQLTIEEFRLQRNPAAERWSIDAHGEFLSGSWNLEGDNRLILRTIPGLERGPALDQDIQLQGRLHGLSLADLAELTYRGGKAIVDAGSAGDSQKAEDLGPVWQNKFFETGVYRIYLENLKLALRLDIENPGEGLPSTLPLEANMRQGYLSVRIPNSFSAQAQVQLRYESNYQSYIPSQLIDFRLASSAPRLSLERFTGDAGPVRDYDLSYAFSGEGVYPGDLVQRSFSRLSIKLSGLRLDRGQQLELLRHALSIPEGPAPIDQLSYVRTTDGPQAQLALRALTRNRDVSIQGEYNIGIGGRLELRQVDLADGSRSSLPLRVQANGDWTPTL